VEKYADILKRLGATLEQDYKANLLTVARAVHALSWQLACAAAEQEAKASRANDE